MSVHISACGGQGLELQTVVNYQTWVSGPKLWSSAKAVYVIFSAKPPLQPSLETSFILASPSDEKGSWTIGKIEGSSCMALGIMPATFSACHCQCPVQVGCEWSVGLFRVGGGRGSQPSIRELAPDLRKWRRSPDRNLEEVHGESQLFEASVSGVREEGQGRQKKVLVLFV